MSLRSSLRGGNGASFELSLDFGLDLDVEEEERAREEHQIRSC